MILSDHAQNDDSLGVFGGGRVGRARWYVIVDGTARMEWADVRIYPGTLPCNQIGGEVVKRGK